MAKVVALSSKPEPPDPLEARRAELMAEAARLNKVAEARAAVELRLQELDQEQSSLDEAERAQWREWALNDAEGPPPSPRAKERQSIDQRRALLARDLTGAMNGQKAVEPRLAALHVELHALLIQIYQRQVGALMSEAETINTEVHAAAAAYVAVCERADGLRDAVVAALERALHSNDRDREAILRSAFSRLETLAAPMLAGDVGERARHAADYRKRLA